MKLRWAYKLGKEEEEPVLQYWDGWTEQWIDVPKYYYFENDERGDSEQ